MGGKNQSQQQQTVRTPVQDENTLASRATAKLVEVLSEGEIYGFATADPAQSVYFGDTPLKIGEAYNFNGISVDFRAGTPDQTYMPGFPNVETETVVDTEVTKYSPKFSGSGDGSASRTITDTDVDAVRVTLKFPGLYYYVPDFESLGQTPLYIGWSGPKRTFYPGDMVEAELTIRIRVTDSLGVWYEIWQTISGKTMSDYERSWRIEMPGTGPWTVKVSRDSEVAQGLDWMEPYYKNALVFSRYTEIKDHKLTYPDTAVVGITADSQVFGGNVEKRAFHVKGILCQIPNNYDPETREYTGVWDGGFVTEYTNNPAWVLYDAATHPRYGARETMDRWGLYSISQYCDELVPDGLGGLEPRYTFNGVINARNVSRNVLQAIASCFRGMVYPGSDGVLYAVADMPADPVQIFTHANLVSYNYTGTEWSARSSVGLVTYNDITDMFRQNIQLVQDDQMLADRGWIQREIAAFGCSSPGQAYRLGKMTLDDERYATDTLNAIGGLNCASLRPGDIISMSDSAYLGVRWAGRIKESIDVDEINIDSTVTLSAGETYNLNVILPDGTIESREIDNVPGTYSILTLSSGFSAAPTTEAMFSISTPTVQPRQFRIVSIREKPGIQYEFTGLLHDPNKYARVENDVQIKPAEYTTYRTGQLDAPLAVEATNYLRLSGSTPESVVTISCVPPRDPRVTKYEFWAAGEGREFSYVGTSTLPTIDYAPVTDGQWRFGVIALDGIGRKSSRVEITRYLGALAMPPANVSIFRIAIRDVEATLTWQAVEDVDLSHYEIRYSALTTGATWGAATILKNNIRSTTYTTAPLAGTFLIKAIDTSGSESVAATLLVVPAEYLKDLNVVETITESPDFLGTKTDVVVDGTDLIMDAVAGVYKTDGTYVFAGNPIDLGASYKNRVTPKIAAYGDDAGYTLETWPALDTIADIFSANSGGWYARLEQRITDGIGLLDVTATTATTIDAELTGSSAIGYDGTLFYLMNGSGAIYTSADKGATWDQVTVSSSCWSTRTRAATLYYDSKIWVIGGFLKTDVWYTADQGENWTEVTTVGSKWALCTAGRACVYDGDIWAFDSDGHAYTTTDGATWTDEGDIGLVIMGIAVFADKLVAICYDSVNFRADLVYESADGTTWTQLEDLPNPMDADGGGCVQVDDHVLVFTASGLYWMDPYATTPSWELRETTVYNSSLNTQTMAIDEDFDAVWGRQYLSGMATINSINTANLRYGTWSEWDDVEIATDYQARSFEFRLLMGTSSPGNLTPRVQSLAVEIDMPDRIESARDVTIASGGTTIDFSADFRAIPAITITAQDMATGDYWVITAQSVSGFTIQFKNSGGSGVERTIDWIARGYGRVS